MAVILIIGCPVSAGKIQGLDSIEIYGILLNYGSGDNYYGTTEGHSIVFNSRTFKIVDTTTGDEQYVSKSDILYPEEEITPIPTIRPTIAPVRIYTPIPTPEVTYTPVPRIIINETYTPEVTYTPTPTVTVEETYTPEVTFAPTPTVTVEETYTPEVTFTPTPTVTVEETYTPEVTYTPTPTVTVEETYTPEVTYTPTPTVTVEETCTPEVTYTPTPTVTVEETYTPTITPTPINASTTKLTVDPLTPVVVTTPTTVPVYVVSALIPLLTPIANLDEDDATISLKPGWKPPAYMVGGIPNPVMLELSNKRTIQNHENSFSLSDLEWKIGTEKIKTEYLNEVVLANTILGTTIMLTPPIMPDGYVTYTVQVKTAMGVSSPLFEYSTWVENPLNSDFLEDDIPTKMKPDERRSVTIKVRNDGINTWKGRAGHQYYLAPLNEDAKKFRKDQDDIWVDVSASSYFTWKKLGIKAPSEEGTYNPQWGMKYYSSPGSVINVDMPFGEVLSKKIIVSNQ